MRHWKVSKLYLKLVVPASLALTTFAGVFTSIRWR